MKKTKDNNLKQLDQMNADDNGKFLKYVKKKVFDCDTEQLEALRAGAFVRSHHALTHTDHTAPPSSAKPCCS